jgi:hypothetical protein
VRPLGTDPSPSNLTSHPVTGVLGGEESVVVGHRAQAGGTSKDGSTRFRLLRDGAPRVLTPAPPAFGLIADNHEPGAGRPGDGYLCRDSSAPELVRHDG